ncbi:hypothetical protein [Diaphorobacter aerolatus]|uniref:Uncharacterized protein n=1 Tax=Diaphorobacter aerolatus TaxID=1288495 RepID=A0A7H0GNR0_9BURK|nr:hypothetical protein [Diaphorobacter aerolatus]QNP49926.1 hypothetical protein H9K75_08725 [Diaphorobacter aerolatus]
MTQAALTSPSNDAGRQRWRIHERSLPIFWLLLSALYLGWLAVFWPGVLGEDSAAVLMEVDTEGRSSSGKTAFWYYFLKATYGTTHRVEVPIALLMLLCAFLFARMLSWYWDAQRRRLLCVFLLVFICAAPHMVYFIGTLYPDAIFAVSSTALLFEIWIVCNTRRAGWLSCGVFFTALPFAVFARPNGILFLLPAVIALAFVQGKGRHVLAAIIGLWCIVIFGSTRIHTSQSQSAVHSLVLFETVKLMQPRAMNEFWAQMPDMNDPWVLRKPKLSPRTLEILEGYRPRELLRAYSDPVYWDMLVFHPSGPQLLGLPAPQTEELTHEFLRYNLWHNLPDIAASRVNVFLAAALAQGGFPALDYAPYVLNRVRTNSTFRRFGLNELEQVLRKIHRSSHEWRWLFWTPWLGIGLLIGAFRKSANRKDVPALLICVCALLQLTGIYLFASAAEYRYLLPLFTLPLTLIPVLIQFGDRKSRITPRQTGNPLANE